MSEETLDILLIEPDEIHVELIREAFVVHGDRYFVRDAATLAAATDSLHTSVPSLIIASHHLPDGPATDLLAADSGVPPLPLVIVTDNGDEQMAVDVIKAGALDYIVKSDTAFLEMPQTAERCLREWQQIELRHDAEASLRAERDRARRYLDIAGVLIVALDREGRVSLINRKGCEVLGSPESDIVGRNWIDSFLPEALKRDARDAFDRMMAGDVNLHESHENSVLTTGGGERLIAWHDTLVLDDQGVAVGTLSSGEDITERRQRERGREALSRLRDCVVAMCSEDDLPGLLESVGVALATADTHHTAFGINLVDAAADPPSVRFYDAATRTWIESGPERGSDVVLRIWQQQSIAYRRDLQSEDAYAEAEQIERTTGEPIRAVVDIPFHCGTLAVSSVDPDAFSDGDLEFFGDIAQLLGQGCTRLRDLRSLAEKEEQFRQSQKMEAVGRLASGVAHDINNVLTVIAGYCQFFQRSLGSHHPGLPHVEEIRKAERRAARLVRQLLTFSRHDIPQHEELALNDLVSGMEAMLRQLLGDDIELAVALHPERLHVRVDPEHMEQVIMNLAANARDAMLLGGQLTIETDDDATAELGPCVCLSVTDTGIGMDAQTRARVFEPFFTTKAAGYGTGLGLAAVYGIVHQSGGQVRVDSEPGRGTTFTIHLPKVDPTSSTAEIEEAEDTANGPGGSETVLLVEDEDLVRELVHRVLVECGYEVLIASRGEEALALCSRWNHGIDLLVTDIVMPGIDGRQLAEQVARRYPGTGVLYMSGYADHTLVRGLALEPGTNFLQKPFEPDELARAVRRALDSPRPELG